MILKPMGKGGSFPGSLALKADKDILKSIRFNGPFIVVTGTNGKTSTANLIASAFERCGYRVVTNRRGDNMKPGIVSALLSSCRSDGTVQADAVVLEIDELSTIHTVPYLPVTDFVINNFFRDQMDRAQEMSRVVETVKKAAASSQSGEKMTLHLNAHDPNTAAIGLSGSSVLWYGVSYQQGNKTKEEAGEGVFCPLCDGHLEYQWHQYSHIGHFECACGFKSPEMNTRVNAEHDGFFSVNDDSFQYKCEKDGVYTLYNYAALMSVAGKYHLDKTKVARMLKQAPQPFGRNETFVYDERKIVLNLIKNPVGTNEVLKNIARDPEPKDVMIVLNDNHQDGRDISWIYDADFEMLNDSSCESITCAGTRAEDMARRMVIGGYRGMLQYTASPEDALSSCKAKKRKLYILSTYTALAGCCDLLEGRKFKSLRTSKQQLNRMDVGVASVVGKSSLKVLWLYPDIMDLYGDKGNVMALEHFCRKYGIQFACDKASVGEDVPMKSYDIIFMGGGADREQKIIAEDLLSRKPHIQEAIDSGALFLLICGGYQMFGKSYTAADGSKVPGLGLASYETTASETGDRCIGNIAVNVTMNGETFRVCGFENHGGQTIGVEHPLGQVVSGHGNAFHTAEEGYYDGSVLGTYLHGPLLPGNPILTAHLVERALQKSRYVKSSKSTGPAAK